MNSNVTLPGTGVVVKTEEVGGAQYQVVKIAHGEGLGTAMTTPNQPFPVGGLRRDEDTAVYGDGQQAPFLFNAYGRLKVSALPADIESVSGAFTGTGQSLAIDCSRASNIVITSAVTTAATGHNATFEFSNDSTNGTDGNWKALQAVRSNANIIETATGVLATTPVYGWEVSVNGCKWFRVRTTAQSAGSVTYTLTPGAYATEPIPAAQISGTQPVSGTVTTTLGSPTNANILNSAANTNGTVVKASAGNLHGIVISNSGAAAAYVKLHNSASVTAGTTAVAMWLKVAAGETAKFDFGPLGARFSAGICLSITGAVADNDTTAVAAGQVKVITSFI